MTFDDTAGVQTAITLNIAATPGSVTISSNTNNFSFSGVGGISGSTGLNKTGTSTLTLGTDNGYSGATSLGGGLTIALNPSGYATGITSTTIASGATFNIGNGTTAGAGNATGAITNNGTLNLTVRTPSHSRHRFPAMRLFRWAWSHHPHWPKHLLR